MVGLLRRELRQTGWTARRLADEFAISEATAKRWLAGKGLTLDKIERLAGLCGMGIADLAREAEHAQTGLARELTLAQERELASDVFLSFLFMTIIGGISSKEVAQDLGVPEQIMEAALAKLERLALIDRLGSGRVRSLVDRSVIFRKSPMRTLFEKHMKRHFMAIDFAAADAVYASEVMKLSDAGAAMLAELIEQHRRDVHALAERDRDSALLQRKWYGILCAMRPLELHMLNEAVREEIDWSK
ncbi:hypothetical protein MB02_04930 [Croceicoccus estronivorus]|nr:hypothetical protein MB02_04930 [Croceicoccus estronivorus]